MALGDHDPRWKDPQGSDNQNLYLWAQNLIKELRKGEYIANSIADGIANSELADMAAWTIKMRNADTAGDAQDVTIDGLTAETALQGALDYIPFWDKSIEEMRKVTPSNIGAAISPSIGMRLLDSGAITNQAALNIVLTSYGSTYRAYKFVLSSFVPVTDDVELWMRFSTDGGSNYDAGASDYSWAIRGLFNNASSGDSADAADSEVCIGGFTTGTFAISNVASEGGIDAEVTLFDPTAARNTRVTYHSGYFSAQTTNGTNVLQVGTGGRLTAQNTDAVRFLFESGNIASGNYAVYGLI